VDLDPVAIVQLRAALLGEEPDPAEMIAAAFQREFAREAGSSKAGATASRPRPVPPLSNAAMRVVEMHRARVLVAASHFGADGLAAIAANGRVIGVPLW
jgi:hypothetical protein